MRVAGSRFGADAESSAAVSNNRREAGLRERVGRLRAATLRPRYGELRRSLGEREAPRAIDTAEVGPEFERTRGHKLVVTSDLPAGPTPG